MLKIRSPIKLAKQGLLQDRRMVTLLHWLNSSTDSLRFSRRRFVMQNVSAEQAIVSQRGVRTTREDDRRAFHRRSHPVRGACRQSPFHRAAWLL